MRTNHLNYSIGSSCNAGNKNDALVHFSNDEMKDLLVSAIQNRCIQKIRSLLAKGADLYSPRSSDNEIPLKFAFETFDKWHIYDVEKDFLKIFLECLPDLHKLDCDGNSLLHYASNHNRVDQLQNLIDAGLDVNGTNNWLETPLINASYKNNVNFVLTLLNNDAIVDAQDIEGNTALAYSALKRSSDCVYLLVDYGANIHNVNSDNRTPLFFAASSDYRTIDLLVKHGANVNATDSSGETPIFNAIRDGMNFNVERLIRYGANINHKNNHGFTPLYCAVDYCKDACVEILLKHNVDLDSTYDFTYCNKSSLTIDAVAKQVSTTPIYELILAYIENRELVTHIEDHKDECNLLCF